MIRSLGDRIFEPWAGEAGARGIFWLRDDCRLHDNPALHAAAAECADLIIVFIPKLKDSISNFTPSFQQISQIFANL